jgi:hypothetical protein
VGKSDGEGVERTWSVLNPASHSTKDAGLGQRADTLEGKIDNHNYLKNVGQGASLFCRANIGANVDSRRGPAAQTYRGHNRARQTGRKLQAN